ncbi:MAG: hypothetical protein ACOX8W_02665 [bacterium]
MNSKYRRFGAVGLLALFLALSLGACSSKNCSYEVTNYRQGGKGKERSFSFDTFSGSITKEINLAESAGNLRIRIAAEKGIVELTVTGPDGAALLQEAASCNLARDLTGEYQPGCYSVKFTSGGTKNGQISLKFE